MGDFLTFTIGTTTLENCVVGGGGVVGSVVGVLFTGIDILEGVVMGMTDSVVGTEMEQLILDNTKTRMTTVKFFTSTPDHQSREQHRIQCGSSESVVRRVTTL